MFNSKEFFKNALIDSVKQGEITRNSAIIKAAGFFDKNLLEEKDLQEIDEATAVAAEPEDDEPDEGDHDE